jgi:hypothetical protein
MPALEGDHRTGAIVYLVHLVMGPVCATMLFFERVDSPQHSIELCRPASTQPREQALLLNSCLSSSVIRINTES